MWLNKLKLKLIYLAYFQLQILPKYSQQIHNYNFIQYYTQLQIVLRKHVIPSSFVIDTF